MAPRPCNSNTVIRSLLGANMTRSITYWNAAFPRERLLALVLILAVHLGADLGHADDELASERSRRAWPPVLPYCVCRGPRIVNGVALPNSSLG